MLLVVLTIVSCWYATNQYRDAIHCTHLSLKNQRVPESATPATPLQARHYSPLLADIAKNIPTSLRLQHLAIDMQEVTFHGFARQKKDIERFLYALPDFFSLSLAMKSLRTEKRGDEWWFSAHFFITA